MRVLQLLRHAAIVVLTTLAVIGIAFAVHRLRPPKYTAEAVLVVPSNAAHHARTLRGYPGPGLETEAQQLALTFAALIPSDQATLQGAGRRLGRSPTQVQANLTVLNDANTAIVRVRYSASTAAEALLGASTVARAVSGPNPDSIAIPPGAMQLVRLPSVTTTAYTLGVLLGVAAVLGIALGLLLVVVLRRANPRLTRSRDLEGLLDGLVVVAARSLTPGTREVVLRKWHDIGERSGRLSADGESIAALIPATRRAAKMATKLAEQLTLIEDTPSEKNNGDPDDVAPTLPGGQSLAGVSLRVATRTGSTEILRRPERGLARVHALGWSKRNGGLELAAVTPDEVIVLVVVLGTSARQLSATVDLLRESARAPDAAIFADRLPAERAAS